MNMNPCHICIGNIYQITPESTSKDLNRPREMNYHSYQRVQCFVLLFPMLRLIIYARITNNTLLNGLS